jgi:hypothetical protein
MRENINKVSQRGERLDSLQDKTDNLAVSAQGFRRGANRVRKQMWWKDMKMRMCLIVGIIVLLIVIIVPAGMFPSCDTLRLRRRNVILICPLQSSQPDKLPTRNSSGTADRPNDRSCVPLFKPLRPAQPSQPARKETICR